LYFYLYRFFSSSIILTWEESIPHIWGSPRLRELQVKKMDLGLFASFPAFTFPGTFFSTAGKEWSQQTGCTSLYI
jgi:hypothetical protein